MDFFVFMKNQNYLGYFDVSLIFRLGESFSKLWEEELSHNNGEAASEPSELSCVSPQHSNFITSRHKQSNKYSDNNPKMKKCRVLTNFMSFSFSNFSCEIAVQGVPTSLRYAKWNVLKLRKVCERSELRLQKDS